MDELSLAEAASRASRDLLLRGGARAESQHGRDIKLREDRASEAAILALLRARSSYPVLSEEAGWIGAPPPPPGGRWWCVDPLDGSWNFFRGVPLCCVSVALCEGERPLLGAIHDFHRDETFSGGPGLGLRLNGASLRPPARDRAVFATGFPARADHGPEAMARVLGRAAGWKKIRCIGSAALALAWVACGRFDGYEEDGVVWWDVAAGLALVEGAGGQWDAPAIAPGGVGAGPLHVRAVGAPVTG